MKCPKCRTRQHHYAKLGGQESKLKNIIFNNVEIDYCPDCLGIWFQKDELRWAKDEKEKDLKWLDIDLWKEPAKFKIAYGIRLCPSCRIPLYEVYYGKSGIIVDVCNSCHGVWLDRREFKKIIAWLKEQADYKILNEYAKSLFGEFTEIFSGPEAFREEILDFLTLFRIFKYRFAAQHPLIFSIISKLPRI